jgi:hypothetical protein
MVTTLTPNQRAITFFNRQLVEPLRWMVTGRQLFEKQTPVPGGKFKYDFNRVTEMGSAIITYGLPKSTVSRDSIITTPDTIELAVISHSWEIPYDTWNSFLTQGIDMPTEAMKSAAYQVAEAERGLLTSKWTPDGTNSSISGLYDLAYSQNNVSTGYSFQTFGNAKNAVAVGLADIMAGKVTGVNFNLVLNAVEWNRLLASVNTNGTIREWNLVLEMLNAPGGPSPGKILMNPSITAGTGLISPADPYGQYIELLVGQDLTNNVGFDSIMGPISPLYGTTYEVLAPHAIHPEALAALSSLT